MAEEEKKKETKKQSTGTKKKATQSSSSTAKKTTKKATNAPKAEVKKAPKEEVEKKEIKVTEVAPKPKTTRKKATTKTSNTTAKKTTTKKETGEENSRVKQLIAEQVERIEEEVKVEKPKKKQAASKKKSETVQKTVEEKKKETVKKEKKIDEKKIEQEIEKNKKLPAEEMKRIYQRIFQNVLIAIAIVAYFIFINLGFVHIENHIFMTDLKVFSIAILGVAIVVFEHAYKKDSGIITIWGIESLIVAIITLTLIYIAMMFHDKFMVITNLIGILFGLYYGIKSTIIYIKMKKEYRKKVSDIKDIIEE